MANRYWLVTCSTFSTISDFSGGEVAGATNSLTWNPHPTEYYPYAEVKIDGDGDGTGLGYANFKWTSGDGILSAAQWHYLMSFFTGSEPTTSIYVKTRVDECERNVFGEYEYSYRWFSAVMHRPKAEFGPDFRPRNVEILFTHAVTA